MKIKNSDTRFSLLDRCGNSIIEVMVVIVVVTTGIVGSYQIAFRGNSMSASTEDRIKAINIAREWLEILENIRDSNWVKLSSDYKGCWDVLNYDVHCIGSSTGASAIKMIPGSYVTSRRANDTWTLIPAVAGGTGAVYRAKFPVYLDSYGLVTQTGAAGLPICTPKITDDCLTRFTREIVITRPANYSEIVAESVVTWTEPGRAIPYEIRIPYTLTNWKYEFYKD